MSVWYCIPSKRPAAEAASTLNLWIHKGYKVALFRDYGDGPHPAADMVIEGTYPGYYASVNILAGAVFRADPDCNWIVTGGDDVHPDPTKAPREIADECEAHFLHLWGERIPSGRLSEPHLYFPISGARAMTYGCMQPTADKWGDRQGPYIERVAGSPWLGREFCARVNRGNGPMWPEYYHMGGDEELQAVAIRLGAFWQRPDLEHFHNHWARARSVSSDMPAFLAAANSPQQWAAYKRVFAERQAAGFPGHEPWL